MAIGHDDEGLHFGGAEVRAGSGFRLDMSHRPHGSPNGPCRFRNELVAAATLFVLLAVALVGPVAWHANQWLYGIGGDGLSGPMQAAQRLWAVQAGGLLAPLPSLVGAPFPNLGDTRDLEPLAWYRSALLAVVLSPVGATNVLVFIGLAATPIAVYVFLRRFGLPIAAASVGALIYGFCPIRLSEAQEHFTLLDGFWLVIECYLLLTLARDLRLRWAVLLGLCLGLAELDAAYLGYFAAVLAACWFALLIGRGLLRHQWAKAWLSFRLGLVVLATLALVAMPSLLPFILQSGPQQQRDQTGSSVIRSIGDVDRLSLRWWNFLLPYPDNSIVGPLGRGEFYAHLGVNTVTEQSTMSGYVALALGLCSLVFAARSWRWTSGAAVATARSGLGGAASPVAGEPDAEVLSLAAIAMVCVVAGVAFGLPPSFVFGTVRIPTPSFFAHAVLPEFRTLSRIDLLIQLGVAILAAIGAWRLLVRIRLARWRHLAGLALAVAILLEYTNVPPWRSVPLLPAPPLYQWLASLSAQQAGIVVQYPIAAADQALTPLYAFYAYDLHHHPLFNGVLNGTPPDALRGNLEDLLNPANPAGWAALGVKTMAVDSAYYQSYFGNVGLRWSDGGAGLVQALPAGLAQRYRDTQWSAYAVTVAPASVVVGVGDDFGEAQLKQDGREWRWVGRHARLWLDNVTDHPVATVIWTSAHNNAATHELSWSGYLPAPVPPSQVESAVALAVEAVPGMRQIQMAVAGPVTPLAGSGNQVPVSVQMRSLEPAPVRPLDAQFQEAGRARWELSGVSMDACAVQAGTAISVALLWNVLAPTDEDQTVFVHLVAPNGRLVAQSDGRPNAGTVATSRLAFGTKLADAHSLALPAALAPGAYHLQAGLYNGDTSARLSLAVGGDTVDLGAVSVVAPSPGPTRIACPWR